MTRLETIYREKVVPALQKEFAYKSPMQIPGIEKISLNIGLGSANQNQKLIDDCVADLTAIAGQKAVVTRAKKSIAAFKLREGMPIGVRVTLRKDAMWDFLDKLMNFAMPRVRDFRRHGTCFEVEVLHQQSSRHTARHAFPQVRSEQWLVLLLK